jgi:predicted nucleotidyltransferase
VNGSVDALLSEAGVLFGSRATGTPRADSDADIAIMVDRPMELLVHRLLSAGLPDLDAFAGAVARLLTP